MFSDFFYGLFDLFCLLCCFMRFFSGLLVSFLFGVLTLFPGLSLLFFLFLSFCIFVFYAFPPFFGFVVLLCFYFYLGVLKKFII